MTQPGSSAARPWTVEARLFRGHPDVVDADLLLAAAVSGLDL